MKVGAIIQARMGSVRLPGKVLRPIVGKPVLWHIANRIKHSELIDEVIIATTIGERDRAVTEMARDNGIPYYAGSEKDLMDRFYQPAKLHKLDVIVRVMADCPLVDPQIADKVVDFYIKNSGKYDFVSNAGPALTYPHGVDIEVFSFSLIERLWKETEDPVDREWFTRVVYNNPKKYKIAFVENDKKIPRLRLTLDYKEDLDLVTYIYEQLDHKKPCFLLGDILDLYSRDKKIFNVNKGYDKEYIEELRKRRIL